MQTIQFECKKDGLRQTQDGGCKLTLVIHPDDVTPELLTASMGQAFMAVLAPVNGGEAVQIEQPKREWKELSHTEQAGILCGSQEFVDYLKLMRSLLWNEFFEDGDPQSITAAKCLRHICEVKSRKDIKKENTAGAKFRHLVREYMEWKE